MARQRASFLLMKLLERAQGEPGRVPGHRLDARTSTPSRPAGSPGSPVTPQMEKWIRRYIRWNAAVMVVRANHIAEGIGGHLATFASSAALYEVGFNHFFRGKAGAGRGRPGLLPGPRRPGIYARAFLEGRLERGPARPLPHGAGRAPPPGCGGLSSYPHPRLMPDFWEFPTVSMGIGPLNAIYQAHFNRYLHNRGIVDTSGSRVWCFVGDGECDEPETLGALSPGRARTARQPHLRRQRQPAAPGRPRAGQRQDHPGARGRLPGRGLERHQGHLGHHAGTSCWPGTWTACCSTR